MVKRGTVLYLLTLIVWLGFFGSVADAARVKPSDRVVSWLNVREQPTAGSSVSGKIHPSDSAELIDNLPHWYRVRLDSGTEGFVSKAWAVLIVAPLDQTAPLRVGSWNLKKLGHENHKDYLKVAGVIESTFDVAALIEVKQKDGGHPGYDTLLSELGPGWKGVIVKVPRPNTRSGNSEYYAFVYRPSRVRLCDGWDVPIYTPDNDGRGEDSTPDVFIREPAFECFEAFHGDTVGMDFLLAAYHARWNKGKKAAIEKEVSNLDKVFHAMKSSRPGEMDLFIVGDFNLGDTDINHILGMDSETLGEGSTLNSDGYRTANIYDHFLVYDRIASKEMVGKPKIVDVLKVAATGKEFYMIESDHLPIVTYFNDSGHDDD